MPESTANAQRTTTGASRRRFIQAVGATGALGVAGCVGDDDEEGVPAEADLEGDETGTVQLDLGGEAAEAEDELQDALYEAGLSEDIEIDVINTSGVSDDVQAQFREWLGAGRTEPDILRMDNGWLHPFIVRQEILNLEEVMDEDDIDHVKDTYYEAGVQAASSEDGDLYGVPFQIGFPVMFYRKDLVEDAGYDPDGENWATDSMSWQEFSQVVAEVRDENDMDYALATQLAEYEGLSCCTFNEFISTWCGYYFEGPEYAYGPVNDRPVTVTEEPVIDAIRMVRAMIHGEDDPEALDGYEEIIEDAVLAWDEGAGIAEFEAENAVAMRMWPAQIPAQGENFGDDLGIMPIPYAEPEDECDVDGLGGIPAALGGWANTINPNSDKIPAAVEVMEVMMEPEVRYTLLGNGTIPAEPDLLEPDAVEEHSPHFAEHVEPFDIAGENAVPRPVTVAWPEQSTAIAREAHAALTAEKTPEDAMNDLEESLVELEEISEV